MQKQFVAGDRIAHERVDDEIEAHARAVAVDGALAQDRRREAVAGQRQERLLAVAFGDRVRAARFDRRRFVEHSRAQAVVERGRGAEDQPRDAAALAGLAQALGRDRVHLPVGVGVVLGGRVVGETGQVGNAVDALEPGVVPGPHVARDRLDPAGVGRRQRLERHRPEKEPVDDPDAVAAFEELPAKLEADVAAPARDQNVHRTAFGPEASWNFSAGLRVSGLRCPLVRRDE